MFPSVTNLTTHLSKHIANFKNFQLRASRLVLRLWHSVRHDDLVKRTGVDAIDGISAQNAVSDQRIHLCGALLLQQLRGTCNCVRGIRQIVDQDGCAIRNVSNQHHGRILPVIDLSWSALLVDQGEGHAEGIGNGGRTFCAASIWTHNNRLLVVWNVELDVLAEEMSAVEVVHRDIEEALILGICTVVSMDMRPGERAYTP
jgi:hypothetical protein